MKRMLIGGGLMLLAFLLEIVSYSNMFGSMVMGSMFLVGLFLFYKGKVAGGELGEN